MNNRQLEIISSPNFAHQVVVPDKKKLLTSLLFTFIMILYSSSKKYTLVQYYAKGG